MTYATRTCHRCGIRKPQPQMTKQQVEIEVARGKRALSNREVFGFLLGNDKARNSVTSWMFAPNARSYTRRQAVWLCSECVASNIALPARKIFPVGTGRAIGKFIIMCFVCSPGLYLSDATLLSDSTDKGVIAVSVIAALIYAGTIIRKTLSVSKSKIAVRDYIFLFVYALAAVDGMITQTEMIYRIISLFILLSIFGIFILRFKKAKDSKDADITEQ